MATLRNVSISLLRLHGVTNIAAALRYNAGKNQRILKRLGAYETPIDKMLSLPPQRATLELVPDQGAEPRPDGP